ncbi:MAG: HD domain-containing protein [Lentimicrobium sp.]
MDSSYNIFDLNFSDFNLNEGQFDHPSRLHGILHTYRVMVHVLRLGLMTEAIKEARLAFFAAYIHDMSRKHDGYCTQHGADSANFKLPLYRDNFLKNGASESELLVIGKAVTLHSTNIELPKNDPDWLTVALLKDADALDRIRLGAGDLNPSFLRLQESHQCIRFGEKLFERTYGMTYGNFVNFTKS